MNHIVPVRECNSASDVWAAARAVAARRNALVRPKAKSMPLMMAAPVKSQLVPFAGLSGDVDGRTIRYSRPKRIEPEPLDHNWHFVQYVMRGRKVGCEADGSMPKCTVKHIGAVVAFHFDLSVQELFSQRRTRRVVLPRQIGMYIASKKTIKSLVQIGQVFGGRDHTTVIHALGKIATMIANDANFEAEVNRIVEKLT